jgi:hypothetical protein
MKYIKTYESFRNNKKEENVNEEFIGGLLKSATGALKNFLGNIMAPLKSLKDDFKKGMKLEEIKKKMTVALDAMLKGAINNINKAKDEGEINQMTDAFLKQIDEKMAEFDKEIKTVKESKVNEGIVQNSLIGGRVLFGILKNEFTRLKEDFDKKFAAAKDLAAKKTVAITRIKTVVDSFKKKIQDEKLIKDATQEYKKENQIKTPGMSQEVLDSYGVKKAEELVDKDVSYKREDYDDAKKAEEQQDMIGTGKVKSVAGENIKIFNAKINKEITKNVTDILPGKGAEGGDAQAQIKNTLGELKKKDPESMKDVRNVLKAMSDENTKKEISAIVDKKGDAAARGR